MDKIKSLISAIFPDMPGDAVAVAVVNFKLNTFDFLEAHKIKDGAIKFVDKSHFYFDLASLTKPLTNSLSYFLKPNEFSKEMLLCLNHKGGLPAWGLLQKNNWKSLIASYPIRESETLYSDFSALRVMLELGKKGIDQKSLCQNVWDKETINWLDLKDDYPVLQFGYRNGLPNIGVVHDPNAYVIHEFCSHAGLFSTIDGISRTLLNYQKKTGFLELTKKNLESHSHRFGFGWDRVENPQNTLAGVGCGKYTFGHLGFTGASIWIDPEKQIGHVILSNATKHYWYQKNELNDLRRALGEIIWKM